MRKKGFLMSLAATSALALVLSACGSSGGQTGGSSGAAGGTIKVATISPLSGPQASLGEAIKLGAELAILDRKADFEKLGFKLELLPKDDQADPKQGPVAANQIIPDQDVLGVVGTLNSGVVIPTSEVLEPAKLAIVSPANTNVKVTDRGLKVMNRICARDDLQGSAGARFLKNDLKAKSVFIIHDKTPYGEGLAAEAKKQAEKDGMQVLGFEGITQGDSDFSAVLNVVKAKNPDAIYFGGIYTEGGPILKQAREKGIKAVFMGGDGLDSSEMVKLSAKAVVGSFYSTAARDISGTDAGKKFAERYQKQFGKNMEGYSAYGYDAALVVLKGIEDAIKANSGKKPTREQVRDAVRKIQDFKGIVTTVSFDSKGDNKNAKIYVYEFKSEKYPGEFRGEY